MYLDGEDSNRAKAIDETIKVWSTFANITFQKTSSPAPAQIRISFEKPIAWSKYGKKALNVDPTEPTVILGRLEDQYPPTARERGRILHEFGHVLGMLHEHQSPTRGTLFTLIPTEILADAARELKGHDDRLEKRVVNDIIREFGSSEMSNYSRLDTKSIMMCAILFVNRILY